MKKKLLKEILINFLITFLVMILSFLINKYFFLYLGIELLGIMKLFTHLLAYLSLVEGGLGVAFTFSLYKPLKDNNCEKIKIIINTIESFYNKIFIFILGLGILFIPLLHLVIKIKLNEKIYIYWGLYVFNTALSYAFIKYSILFTADQKFQFVKIIQGSSKIICQIFQIITIIKLRSFTIFILFLILDNLMQFLIFKYYYKRDYQYISWTSQKDSSIIKDLKNLFFHKVGALVLLNTDLILISKFVSLEMVSIYSSYQMVVRIVIVLMGILFNILRPKVGKFIAENNKEKIYEYWKKLNILLLLISLIFSFGTYKLIKAFVILWLGKDFVLSDFTISLICINLFILCFRGIMDIFKEGSGFFDDIYLPIAEVLINLISSLILVKYFGLNGVIGGTILANVLVISIARPILVFKRCFNKNIRDYIGIYQNYIILILIFFICNNFILNYIEIRKIESFIDLIIQGVIVTFFSLTLGIIIFIFNKDFYNNFIKDKIQYLLKKKEEK